MPLVLCGNISFMLLYLLESGRLSPSTREHVEFPRDPPLLFISPACQATCCKAVGMQLMGGARVANHDNRMQTPVARIQGGGYTLAKYQEGAPA